LRIAGFTPFTSHSALRTPHSALRIPHSALRIPHSALKVSPATVRNHIRNILRKTRAHSRLEALLHGIRNGII